MQFDEIKAIIKKECKENGIKFFHGRGPTVRHIDGLRVNGFFEDGTTMKDGISKLAVASNPNSLEVLVHEYCHMQQYLEQTPEWQALHRGDEFWGWLNGQEGLEDEKIIDCAVAYYEIEVDCEKRAVEQHKLWKTDTNLTEYIQKANAYTLFYFYVLDTRKWYKAGREPYTLKEVWSKMPKSFTFDVGQCYNKHRQLFDLCV